jgi:hypothetical protein
MSEHGEKGHIDVHPGRSSGGLLRYIPYFSIVLILYMFMKASGVDAHATWGSNPSWAISWGEVLLILAAVLALAEQMKVSHPGIDNTMEALSQVFMGVLQLVLFVLGVAGVVGFGWFNDSGFMMQTFISLSASVVAVMINARTLRRTMALGGDS